MGIEAPIPISSKLGDFNNLFRRIVVAAEHPHLSIPETEAGRTRKQYHRLINRSLMFVSGVLTDWSKIIFILKIIDSSLIRFHLHVISCFTIAVGAAVAIVGLAAYRVYAARKNTSGWRIKEHLFTIQLPKSFLFKYHVEVVCCQITFLGKLKWLIWFNFNANVLEVFYFGKLVWMEEFLVVQYQMLYDWTSYFAGLVQ